MHTRLRLPTCVALLAVSLVAQTPPAPTLKDTYHGLFHIGVALNPGQFTGSNPQGAALVLREFDCISPENVLKWGATEPAPGQFDFDLADRYVDFGVKHHLFIIGHNLCWHSQLPAWVSRPDPGQEKLTKEVLMARLRNHIFTVAGRYKGKINGWDVVNEAISDGAGNYRPAIFYQVIGKEYLAWAFKWAHEAAPDAELYYNDYNLDANDAKRATALELVQYLRAQGAPIDGIGLQGHYNLSTPKPEKIDETIQMFADLGLKVMITELDVQAVRGAAITGAVGANARGGRGRGGLPALAALKSSLNLSDEQAGKIGPLLEAHAANVAAAAGDFGKIVASRNATLAAIRPLLTEAQRKSFDEQFMPQPGGGAPVGARPPPLTAEQQQALAQRYGELFAVFLKHRAAITRVTFWGLRDADSWRRGSSPLIFDDNYQPKPAYHAVIAAVAAAGIASPR